MVETEMITVFGAPPTRALRVVWMLEEMGLEYEIRPVDFAKRFEDAEFLAASPAGSIPGIRDGGVQMMESCAILEYLGAKYGPTSLAPSDRRRELSRVYFFPPLWRSIAIRSSERHDRLAFLRARSREAELGSAICSRSIRSKIRCSARSVAPRCLLSR